MSLGPDAAKLFAMGLGEERRVKHDLFGGLAVAVRAADADTADRKIRFHGLILRIGKGLENGENCGTISISRKQIAL